MINNFTKIAPIAKVLTNGTIGHHVYIGVKCVEAEDLTNYATTVLNKQELF